MYAQVGTGVPKGPEFTAKSGLSGPGTSGCSYIPCKHQWVLKWRRARNVVGNDFDAVKRFVLNSVHVDDCGSRHIANIRATQGWIAMNSNSLGRLWSSSGVRISALSYVVGPPRAKAVSVALQEIRESVHGAAMESPVGEQGWTPAGRSGGSPTMDNTMDAQDQQLYSPWRHVHTFHECSSFDIVFSSGLNSAFLSFSSFASPASPSLPQPAQNLGDFTVILSHYVAFPRFGFVLGRLDCSHPTGLNK